MLDNVPDDTFFLNSLAQFANDVVLVTRAEAIDDPAGPEIVYCNTAFERMTGWSRAEVIGKSPRILQTPETDRAELSKIRAALVAWNAGDEAARARVELLNQKKNGERFWVEIQMFPVWDDAYKFSYWVAIQRDISERIARENLVRNALAAAEQAKILQETFLAQISHEFRTPLNAIVGFTDYLHSGLAGPLTPQQKEFVDAIHHGSEQLSELVKDFLDYIAATRGKIATKIERLSTQSLIDYVLTVEQHQARSRGVELTSAPSPDLAILGDEVRARQCLTNLVDNAIKYSDPNSTVTIAAERIAGEVFIHVKDQGCGLTESEVQLALLSFGQVARPDGSLNPGLGIGLPLTMHLMQRQNGRLQVHSAPGVGSTFSLAFQVAPDQDA